MLTDLEIEMLINVSEAMEKDASLGSVRNETFKAGEFYAKSKTGAWQEWTPHLGGADGAEMFDWAIREGLIRKIIFFKGVSGCSVYTFNEGADHSDTTPWMPIARLIADHHTS